MATYSQTYTFANGSTADGGEVNTEIVALGASVNNIVDAQVSATAAIGGGKLDLETGTLAITNTGDVTTTGDHIIKDSGGTKSVQITHNGTDGIISNTDGFITLDPANSVVKIDGRIRLLSSGSVTVNAEGDLQFYSAGGVYRMYAYLNGAARLLHENP